MRLIKYLLILSISLAACNPSRKAAEANGGGIFDRYWKLVEAGGSSVPSTNKEPHMILNQEESRVTGNGSCNSFFGSFQNPVPFKITFSPIGSTKMACPKMDVETRFFEALEQARSYSIKNDTLFLENAGKETVAKFVAQLMTRSRGKSPVD